MKDIDIKTNITTTIRELKPGDHYITLTKWRKHGATNLSHDVLVRTEDPFISLTYFGSKVTSFPSEKVHPVEVLERSTP